MSTIPLRNRAGEVIAETTVDAADHAALAALKWHRTTYGYAGRGVWSPAEQRVHHVALHRVLMGLERGDPREVDHINGDRLDNRRANLRIVEKAHQAQNVRGRGRSRHRGVCWHKAKRKWMAYSYVDRRIRYLGYYADEEAAASAAAAFRREHMPLAVEGR